MEVNQSVLSYKENEPLFRRRQMSKKLTLALHKKTENKLRTSKKAFGNNFLYQTNPNCSPKDKRKKKEIPN